MLQLQFGLSLCFSGFSGVWEQLQFTSVRSVWTPGLLEHQSIPSQVLCLDLSGGTLLQPLPHQDGTDCVPLPPRQAYPAAGDDDRVLLLQRYQLPSIPSHSWQECPVSCVAVRCVCIHLHTGWADPVCENKNDQSYTHDNVAVQEVEPVFQNYGNITIRMWNYNIESRCADTSFVNVHSHLKVRLSANLYSDLKTWRYI